MRFARHAFCPARRHLFDAIIAQPRYRWGDLRRRARGGRRRDDLAGHVGPASGLRELFDEQVDLGDAPGRAHVGHKAMTVIHSALAGGDSIDDCDALRAGATQAVLGHGVLAPSTIGIFLRSCTWGHARQLDKVAGEALARAWAAGAGPGDAPVTIASTRPSMRPTGWPSRAGPSSPAPRSAATTRCTRSSAAPATWSTAGCGAATPTRAGARPAS
jgi:hypothetical protein